jgi:hypothetical protein
MPERWNSCTFVSSESHSYVPAVATRTPPRTALPTPTLLYQWIEFLRFRKYDLSRKTTFCECRLNRTWPPKAHCNSSADSALDTCSETAVTRLDASRAGVLTSPVVPQLRGNRPSTVAAGKNIRQTKRVVWSGKKRRPNLQSRRPIVAEGAPPQPTITLRKKKADPSAEMQLGEGCNHADRGGVLSRSLPHQPLFQIPLPSRPRKLTKGLKWQPPWRRPGLRILSPKLQQPLSRLLGSFRTNQPRVSNPEPLNPLPPTS